MNLGKILLRVVVGGAFIGHGLQKLNGSFGGNGIAGTEKMAEKLGMHPARPNAYAVALTETVGGAAIVAGAATPLAAAGLIATMVTAVHKVHFKNGPWNGAGGYEYNAVLIAAVAALAGGAGKISIDGLFGKAKWGAKGTLFALGAGVAGSMVAVELGRRNTPAVEDAVDDAEPTDVTADDAAVDAS